MVHRRCKSDAIFLQGKAEWFVSECRKFIPSDKEPMGMELAQWTCPCPFFQRSYIGCQHLLGKLTTEDARTFPDVIENNPLVSIDEDYIRKLNCGNESTLEQNQRAQIQLTLSILANKIKGLNECDLAEASQQVRCLEMWMASKEKRQEKQGSSPKCKRILFGATRSGKQHKSKCNEYLGSHVLVTCY